MDRQIGGNLMSQKKKKKCKKVRSYKKKGEEKEL